MCYATRAGYKRAAVQQLLAEEQSAPQQAHDALRKRISVKLANRGNGNGNMPTYTATQLLTDRIAMVTAYSAVVLHGELQFAEDRWTQEAVEISSLCPPCAATGSVLATVAVPTNDSCMDRLERVVEKLMAQPIRCTHRRRQPLTVRRSGRPNPSSCMGRRLTMPANTSTNATHLEELLQTVGKRMHSYIRRHFATTAEDEVAKNPSFLALPTVQHSAPELLWP